MRIRTDDAARAAYEAHVTVRCGPKGLPRLERWARDAGLKLTHIVLARGRMVSQPMLTLTGADGFDGQHAAARAVAARLRRAGFEPVRVKIEASPWAPEVPRDDAEAAGLGPGRYFEHHIKLLLDADTDLGALPRPSGSGTGLAALATAHGAHLSWNARRVRSTGRHERFVTQRCHTVGVDQAGRRLTALLDAVGAEHPILSVEREFVLYDSNLSIDDGWIS